MSSQIGNIHRTTWSSGDYKYEVLLCEKCVNKNWIIATLFLLLFIILSFNIILLISAFLPACAFPGLIIILTLVIQLIVTFASSKQERGETLAISLGSSALKNRVNRLWTTRAFKSRFSKSPSSNIPTKYFWSDDTTLEKGTLDYRINRVMGFLTMLYQQNWLVR